MDGKVDVYIIKQKIAGMDIGEKLHLDDSKNTFAMKGLVNEGGWLYVIPEWQIRHAIEEGFIEKVEA